MIFKLLLPVLISFPTYAMFGGTYGATALSSSIANQTTTSPKDGSNNYYAPSLMGFSKEVVLDANFFYINSDFEPIENIRTKNNTTYAAITNGTANTNYDDSYMLSMHAILPIMKATGPKLGVSIFTPVNSLQESNTGDGFLPEYVMYKARHRRTTLVSNLSYAWNDMYSFSIGFYSGLQASANSFVVGGGNGGTTTHGNLKIDAKPSISPIVSFATQYESMNLYFTYQHEMKQNLETVFAGEAFNPINVVYNLDVNTMLYYDPSILRFGGGWTSDLFNLYASLDYQLWENYKAPTMEFTQKGGVIVSSGKYEQIQTKSIIVPRVGISFHMSDEFKLHSGLAYEPTPLDSDFSGSGNSIDSDSTIISGGLTYSGLIFDQTYDFNTSIQHRMLASKTVTKSPNEENGTAGLKIGGPSYNIGGSITTVSVGVKVEI